MDKKIYQKKWFIPIVVILFILGIIGIITEQKESTMDSSVHYINSYEWKLKDTKETKIKFNNGDEEMCKYVVIGVENKSNDLESGKYVIQTNDNKEASFMIYVSSTIEENIIPEDDYVGMVQGFDHSKVDVELKKGQYLYIVQNYNKQGKVLITKK